MNDEKPLDILQIKIDRAKEDLPKETLKAINSVDWREVILGMREKKGYSYEQLEDLELETELLLCGLLNPSDYPKELEERMKLPKPQIDLLVQEMNEFVFKKIKDELIKNTERQEIFIKKEEKIEGSLTSPTPNPIPIKTVPVNPAVANINTEQKDIKPPIPSVVKSDLENEKNIKSILSQKLSGAFQVPTTKTQYSSDDISKTGPNPIGDTTKTPKTDPYRIDPNE